MSLYIASLNSGSNGNCYYIGNKEEAVLIDAGISCREIEKRMKLIGLKMEIVKAIFVSHEHTDHISGIGTLSKKYKLPVYITEGTIRQSGLLIDSNLICSFLAGVEINIGGLSVVPFKKHHDAGDPHSFIVKGNGVTIGVFTDIGKVCDQLILHFKCCHAAFLESNYDMEMLESGNYPYYLKRRISGGMGHLSNDEALELFTTHRHVHLSHLLLSHLSKNNNSPELAMERFLPFAGETEVVVAPRFKASNVYEISAPNTINNIENLVKKNDLHMNIGLQMKMF